MFKASRYLPVTVPSRCAIVRLGSVVFTLAVSAEEEDLVDGVQGSSGVQSLNLSCELLPLGQVGRDAFGRGIAPVDEAEVGRSLAYVKKCIVLRL